MEGFLKLSTAVNATVLMIDSTDHVTGKTGLSAGLTIYATKAAGTPATITPTVTELDATNVKGVYKLAFTTGHTDTLGELQLHITATGADPCDIKWQVATYLPGEAATLQADQAVNTTKVGGTTQTARDLGASVLLSTGTGTGQLDFTSGVVKANATQWLGGTIPAVNVTGVPLIDLKYTLGTISPATAGSVRADAVTGAVGSVTGAVGSVTGAVGSVTARVTANTDQLAGQTVTAAAGVTFPGSVASPTNITAGTITTATNVTNDVGITQAGADKVWGTTVRALTDKVGFALSTAGVQAIWDALTSALTTVGSIGKLIVTNLDAAISSRMATFSYTAPLDAAGTRAAVGLASANLDTQLAGISAPSAGAVADAVWDEILSGHVVSGSSGEALAAAGSAGDPWIAPLPGAYSSGTAGFIVGTNLDALISSRTKPADTQAAVTTVTNLTNAPTAGDLTATMKTSVTTAATAATPTAAAVTGNLGGNVVGNVNGNVVGSVGSVTGLTASNVGAIKTVTDKLNTTMESVGSPGDYVFTAPALAQVPSSTAIASDVSAIKVKTDSLTFTTPGNVDANIQYVNDTQIQGTGAVGSDEWRKV